MDKLETGLIVELEKYLKQNPNLLTSEEKNKVRKLFMNFMDNSNGIVGVEDLLGEFFEYMGFEPSKENDFVEYIIKNYPKHKYPRVLDVATGKVCSMAQKLRDKGYKVTAMDPDIRIKPADSRIKGVKLLKRRLTPDFRTSNFDLVVGFGACPVAATLLNIKDKPVVFTICEAPQTDGKLDIGSEINSKSEFVEQLLRRGACIKRENGLTIVDNSRILELNRGFEREHDDR